VVRDDIFIGSLAVFTKERGEPACGRAAPEGEPSVPYGAGKLRGFSSPPQAAKNVQTNLSIRSQ